MFQGTVLIALRAALISSILLVFQVANSEEDPDLEQWGVLTELAETTWIESDIQPVNYSDFIWEPDLTALNVSGLDSDGIPTAGRFTMDFDTGEILFVTVRRGNVAQFNVVVGPDTVEMTGSDNGTEVKRIYERKNAGSFLLRYQERRGGGWRDVAQNKLFKANLDMVDALGWLERNPLAEREAELARAEALALNPGFLTRLRRAAENGLVVGVEDGVREGTQEKVYEIIKGNGNPRDDDY